MCQFFIQIIINDVWKNTDLSFNKRSCSSVRTFSYWIFNWVSCFIFVNKHCNSFCAFMKYLSDHLCIFSYFCSFILTWKTNNKRVFKKRKQLVNYWLIYWWINGSHLKWFCKFSRLSCFCLRNCSISFSWN